MRMRHIVVCDLSGFKIFHIIWHNFRKTVIEHEISFIISYSKNWASYDQTSLLVFMQNTRYSCQILMKIVFSSKIFEEYSNTSWKSIKWD
jgi:hypothetical protein